MVERPITIHIQNTYSSNPRRLNNIFIRVLKLGQKLGVNTSDYHTWELMGGTANDTITVTPKGPNWPFQNGPPLAGPGNQKLQSGPLKDGLGIPSRYPYTLEVTRPNEKYVLDPDMIVDDDGGGGDESEDEEPGQNGSSTEEERESEEE